MGSLDKALLTGFICRICSKMNKVVIHVYGEEGERINLASQLQNYLGVDIYLNDNLPKTVCPSCVIKLRMYYEWMELIMKTQKEFGTGSNESKMLISLIIKIVRDHKKRGDGRPDKLMAISGLLAIVSGTGGQKCLHFRCLEQ